MNTFLSDILDQPAALNAVIDFYQVEGQDLLKAAVDSMKAYSRVVLTSMGSAFYSLMPAYYALFQHHPNIHLIETAELMGCSIPPGSTYLIMSRSGESGEIAEFSSVLRAQKQNLLAVTMTPTSTLANNANLVLPDPAPFDGFICTKAYTSMALIGLLLSSQLNGELNLTLINNLRRMTTWLEENKQQLFEEVAAIPWLGSGLTFLSRGAGMGVAMSGALWMAEGARVRSDYSSIDQFRHGAIEMVDHHFCGVGIDLVGDLSFEQQMQKLSAMGGNLATIRIADRVAKGISIPTFDLPVAYRTLPAAMPVQMLAYQTGIRRGEVPGEMRYLDWVVK